MNELPAGSELQDEARPPLPEIAGFSYPICWEQMSWNNGRRPLWVLRPEDFEPLLDDPDVRLRNAADDYMPYWAQAWSGAFVLADALLQKTWPHGTQALEIGCGLGVTGLAALQLGMKVDFTDHEPLAVAFALASARANGFSDESCGGYVLDYRWPTDRKYPLILGGEVLYEERLVRQVCGLLVQMLAPGGEAWLADPYRRACDRLDEIVAEAGLTLQTIESSALTNRGERVSGFVRIIRHATGAGK